MSSESENNGGKTWWVTPGVLGEAGESISQARAEGVKQAQALIRSYVTDGRSLVDGLISKRSQENTL